MIKISLIEFQTKLTNYLKNHSRRLDENPQQSLKSWDPPSGFSKQGELSIYSSWYFIDISKNNQHTWKNDEVLYLPPHHCMDKIEYTIQQHPCTFFVVRVWPEHSCIYRLIRDMDSPDNSFSLYGPETVYLRIFTLIQNAFCE